ncbi:MULTISPECIES: hypothetical protein [unclassified Streptomyces]|uniref:Uncharacterized protein n=1 Tax=Streptomyces sp. NBC_00060 TaxID=2975636 RepID=A0AAU2H7T6_9ACTN
MTRRLTGEQPEIDAATEDGIREDDFWWPAATLPTAGDDTAEPRNPADSRAAGKYGCTARV